MIVARILRAGQLGLLLIGLPLVSLGQATRPVTVKREKPEYFTEVYSVLAADGRTRHGRYGKNGLLNRSLVRGYYRHGQKDSTWTFYYAPSGRVQSRGRYRAGHKVGLWEYWHDNGQQAFRYDHTRGTLESLSPPADALTETVEQSGQRLTSPPRFVGGDESRWFGGDGRVRYPNAALKRLASGKVIVEFSIDERGNATDFRVIKSQDPALDQEALRAARQAFDNWWLPGTAASGRPVRIVRRLPFTFTIQ
ncbi:TonB family protein [Hymenobacter sp. B81]|uniref:TonB family protein n=1 Tax=Hymenobacter sp. B81 TaxID=3344878 RepID=UPI0037DD9FE8